jgi:hypothetical protein
MELDKLVETGSYFFTHTEVQSPQASYDKEIASGQQLYISLST